MSFLRRSRRVIDLTPPPEERRFEVQPAQPLAWAEPWTVRKTVYGRGRIVEAVVATPANDCAAIVEVSFEFSNPSARVRDGWDRLSAPVAAVVGQLLAEAAVILQTGELPEIQSS